MPDSPAELPEAELEVMALLWRAGSATTRDICQGLAPHRRMGLAAAQTLLLRLESKGLVKRQKIAGRNAYRYRPTRGPQATYRHLTRKLLDRIFGGSATQLVASLFAGHQPDAREIEQIEKLLAEMKRTRRRGAETQRRDNSHG